LILKKIFFRLIYSTAVESYVLQIGIQLHAFFWVIPRCLNFICQRFGTLCSTFIGASEDGTECSETLTYEFQTPGNYPEESIQLSVQGESLKWDTAVSETKNTDRQNL